MYAAFSEIYYKIISMTKQRFIGQRKKRLIVYSG